MNKKEWIKQYTNINGVQPTEDQIQVAIENKKIDTKFKISNLAIFQSIKNFFITVLSFVGIIAIIITTITAVNYIQDKKVENTLNNNNYLYKKSNRELLLKTSGGRFIITDNTKEKDNKTLNNKIYRGSIDKQNLKTDEIDYQQISVKNNKVVTKNYKLKKNNFILKSFSKKKVVLQFKGEPTFYTLTTKGSSKVSNYSALDWIKQIINNVISSISKGALGLLGGIGNLIKNSIPVF